MPATTRPPVRLLSCSIWATSARRSALGATRAAICHSVSPGATVTVGSVRAVCGPAAWLDARSHPAPRVQDIATDPGTYVDGDATVQQVARLMRDTGLDAVPVVRRDGRLVGVLTRTDLVRLLAGP